MKRVIFFLFFILVFQGCSGISMIGGNGNSSFYRSFFSEKIEKVKQVYASGKKSEALLLLSEIPEGTLLPAEKAMRRNLIGVIYFSQNDLAKAIEEFNIALRTSSIDRGLTAQIYLNLASCYYKNDMLLKAYSELSLGEPEFLGIQERKKYGQLKFKLAKELDKPKDLVDSLILYLSDIKTVSSLKHEQYFEILISYFSQVKDRQKLHFFDQYSESKYLVISYLAFLEAERSYYAGNKERSEDLIDWITDNYKDSDETRSFVDPFRIRMANLTKIDPLSIGVILPLSGKKKEFGKRVLLGIENFLKTIDRPYKLFVKDSKGSGSAGIDAVEKLVDQNKVSFIIGGLFSNEACLEYIEAKKNGVFFVSLSQVFLPIEEKNHMLIEIPGSIESQIDNLFNETFLEAFGKKVAILYPNSERGKMFANEFWRMSQVKGVKISSIFSYEKNKTDFRELS